jgi:hypothetical protein
MLSKIETVLAVPKLCRDSVAAVTVATTLIVRVIGVALELFSVVTPKKLILAAMPPVPSCP